MSYGVILTVRWRLSNGLWCDPLSGGGGAFWGGALQKVRRTSEGATHQERSWKFDRLRCSVSRGVTRPSSRRFWPRRAGLSPGASSQRGWARRRSPTGCRATGRPTARRRSPPAGAPPGRTTSASARLAYTTIRPGWNSSPTYCSLPTVSSPRWRSPHPTAGSILNVATPPPGSSSASARSTPTASATCSWARWPAAAPATRSCRPATMAAARRRLPWPSRRPTWP